MSTPSRHVLSAVFWGQGGRQKCPLFCNLRSTYFIGFYTSPAKTMKVLKIISMIRKIDWLALHVHARACSTNLENFKKSSHHELPILTRSACANFWSTPLDCCDHRHDFDNLIANLAKKNEKIQFIEFQQNFLKNSKISKLKHCRFFVYYLNFEINVMHFHCF